jgi:hypothetical protein
LEVVEPRQLLSNAPTYVLGNNGTLWLESPGWQTNGRTFIDSNVVAFIPAGAGDLYVLGTDTNLWLEGPYWQTTGRTFIDSHVESFAPVGAGDPFAPHGYGDLYVMGSNRKLWLEGPGWQTNGRIPVDSNVKSFAPIPDGRGDLYVEGSDDRLWREAPGWQTSGRTFIDGNVLAYAADPFSLGSLYVEGTNGVLWYEPADWQTNGRTPIDSNVMNFIPDPNDPGSVYVEGTDEKLWLETAGWQTVGRVYIDATVESFAIDPNTPGPLYVEGINGNLWLESPGWQYIGRTWVDANVTSFAGQASINPAATGYSPPSPDAMLFSPANNYQPSSFDVEQGALNDCWLMASLAEVAARDPQAIKNMFTYDGSTVDNGDTVGLFTVRLYTITGVAIYVQVDTDLPSGGDSYAQVDTAMGTHVLWVALAEKAYMEANSLGCVDSDAEYLNAYGAINQNGGFPGWAIIAITGNPVSRTAIYPGNIADAWNAGRLITLNTPNNPPSSLIVGGHCYAVVGYNGSSGDPWYMLFNAWGTDTSGWAPGHSGKIYGVFWASASFIEQNFFAQTIGTGASPTNEVKAPLEALTAPLPGNGGYAQFGTINLKSGGDRPATGSTAPAQGTSALVDLWFGTYDADGDDPTTLGLKPRRNVWR